MGKEEIIVSGGEGKHTYGAIGTPQKSERSTTLSLMDELRSDTKPLRRYRCSCGCEGCVCSPTQVYRNDRGTDLSLADLCGRLEGTLGVSGSALESSFRDGGGSQELRHKLSNVSFPCGCDSWAAKVKQNSDK